MDLGDAVARIVALAGHGQFEEALRLADDAFALMRDADERVAVLEARASVIRKRDGAGPAAAMLRDAAHQFALPGVLVAAGRLLAEVDAARGLVLLEEAVARAPSSFDSFMAQVARARVLLRSGDAPGAARAILDAASHTDPGDLVATWPDREVARWLVDAGELDAVTQYIGVFERAAELHTSERAAAEVEWIRHCLLERGRKETP